VLGEVEVILESLSLIKERGSRRRRAISNKGNQKTELLMVSGGVPIREKTNDWKAAMVSVHFRDGRICLKLNGERNPANPHCPVGLWFLKTRGRACIYT